MGFARSIWDDTEHPDSTEVRRLNSEIERLRAALQQIVDLCDTRESEAIARRALAPTERVK